MKGTQGRSLVRPPHMSCILSVCSPTKPEEKKNSPISMYFGQTFQSEIGERTFAPIFHAPFHFSHSSPIVWHPIRNLLLLSPSNFSHTIDRTHAQTLHEVRLLAVKRPKQQKKKKGTHMAVSCHILFVTCSNDDDTLFYYYCYYVALLSIYTCIPVHKCHVCIMYYMHVHTLTHSHTCTFARTCMWIIINI